MTLRFIGSALVVGLALLLSPGAGAQTSDSTPEATTTSPDGAPSGTSPATGEPAVPAPSAETDAEDVPAVEVVQPKPKPRTTARVAQPKPKPVAKRTPPPAPPTPPPDFAERIAPIGEESTGSVMSPGTTVPMSPVPGAEIPLSKVPSGVSIVEGQDFARQGYVDSTQEVLQQRVPGVIIGDAQGNVFQTNVQFRGFEASPVNGVPQGLAVYQDGVRINESFGDIVNWDFLPQVAVGNMTVLSNNPVYGLNALGGAVVVNMKNGFDYHGAEITASGGSFGRAQGTAEVGMQSGNVSLYWGGERITDDGYRDFSPAEVRRMYGDLGFKNKDVEVHLNITAADNFVGVTAAAPVQLLGLGWNRTFSSPQTTVNEVVMPALNATVNASDTLSFAGVAYYRHFKQSHDDGNISEAEDCEAGQGLPGTLCIEGEQLLDQTGNPIDDDIAGTAPLGSIDRTSQDAEGWGTSLQAVEKSDVFGHKNQFLVGASYDRGDVTYNASSELGAFQPKFVVDGLGIILSSPNDVKPRELGTTNDYYGIYFSDTLDITDRLAATAGGRWNYARIEIEDLSGTASELDGINQYHRFNPMGGLTYQLNHGMSLYGGYSEANRAPVAAELACADPENPCLLESFLTADPPLEQVISHTWETGIKGEQSTKDSTLAWSLGVFRTLNTDDIVAVFSDIAGRGVFTNAGDTLRQGVEASVSYKTARWFTYANYAFIRGTFEDSIELPSQSPLASPCTSAELGGDDDDDEGEGDDDDDLNCVFVSPGDQLPGIPEHRFKAGADYWVTPKWKVGTDVIAVSSQIFFGDESNLDRPLGGYMRVDLNTTYDLTPRVQLFGLVNNVFNTHYGVFGTYANLEAANSAAGADPSTGDGFFTNARTITPAPPFVIYGGAKVKFW